MPIVTLTNAVFQRPDGGRGGPWSFEWNRDDHWAIVGGTGSGKTTLLKGLAGQYRIVDGKCDWHVDGEKSLVTFQQQQGYYQQRYEFADSEEPLSVEDYLGESMFGLRLDQPLCTLSTGQMRKARLAKALQKKPAVLLLDDPFSGLDVASRAELAALIQTLPMPVLIACREQDVPGGFKIFELPSFHSLPLREGLGEGVEPLPPSPAPPSREGSEIIELRNVTVRHGGRNILENINWTIREGERWALTGPNGVGKTTLLSLIVGDHPQAFSNDVRLFGSRRGRGETIWDVKKRVGFVSPEFHAYFAEDLTAAEAAETGFTDTLLHSAVTDDQRTAVRRLFEELGLSDLADRRMRRLSTGQQRLALIVRALVKRPPLLVLDEPCQGLSGGIIQRLNEWLCVNLSPHQTLILTTHREEELPPIITHRKTLGTAS